MKVWEYRTISGYPRFYRDALDAENEDMLNEFLENTSKRLRKLGEEGWEVVSSHVLTIPSKNTRDLPRDIVTYTLKRQANASA